METKLKEIDNIKLNHYGKLKEHSDLLDDGKPFITKEKSRLIFEKFKVRR